MININYYLTSDSRWFVDLCKEFQSVENSNASIDDTSLLLNPTLGEGEFDFIELSEGLGVLCLDYTFHKDVCLKSEPAQANDYFMINFNVGDDKIIVKNSEGEIINTGEAFTNSILYSSAGLGSQLIFPKDKRIKIVQVIASCRWMFQMVHYYNLMLNDAFQDYSTNTPFQKCFNLDLDCRDVALSVLKKDVRQSISKLEIKADVMELLFFSFRKFSVAMVKEKKLVLNDIEKIKVEIAALEHSDKYDWPSTETISKMCGMSKTKFRILVNKIYGCTYSELCLSRKIKCACKMITDSEVMVSQVAWAIGYTNLGHFSKVFKEYTGVLPSEFTDFDKKLCKVKCVDCIKL